MQEDEPLKYHFSGHIQQRLFDTLVQKKKLTIHNFKTAYTNPEIGTNVLKKMVAAGVARLDPVTQVVEYIPPKERKR